MLREFVLSDLSAVIAIEKSVQVDPWSMLNFQTCLNLGCDAWVIEFEKQVIGFIVLSVQADQAHIFNVAVARHHQHQGWGRQLMQKAMDFSKDKSVSIIYLEVRESNTRAIALYESLQFTRIDVRKNYYQTVSGMEDAWVMAKTM